MMSMTAQAEMRATMGTSTPASVAGLIHDDVLQSLGVAVLGVDLGRRLHERMRYEQALAELTGIVDALELALASTEGLAPDLLRFIPPVMAPAARPGLKVLDSAGTSATEFQAAGPDEIIATLAACLLQARRCRHQYDAGLGEETMRDLELLMQRLEFVSISFRKVMGQLRELSTSPVLPQARIGTWARTA
ncbi:MAG: hypothetical protein AB7K36_22230 [Chloroflexota bacterium]